MASAARTAATTSPVGPVVMALASLGHIGVAEREQAAQGLLVDLRGESRNLAMYFNVALAVRNCDFAEIMVPPNLLSMDMADLPTIDGNCLITGPCKPGLSYDIDRDAVENLTLRLIQAVG